MQQEIRLVNAAWNYFYFPVPLGSYPEIEPLCQHSLSAAMHFYVNQKMKWCRHAISPRTELM